MNTENSKTSEPHRFKLDLTDKLGLILIRLPISLVQLKSGNNSEILKNKIRQLLHSLSRSKKLTNQFCKSLVDII